MRVVHALAKKYELHPLALEDLLHPGTRPKIESYPASEEHSSRLFILARMIYLVEKQLHCEQVCFFLGQHTLITFQSTPGDVWGGVRARIKREGSRIRNNDVSFLLYALIDAVVDQVFPVLEYYSDRLEEIEEEVLLCPDTKVIRRIHEIKRELLLLRREFWPMREMVHTLQRADHANFSETASLFLRDVYDHSVQVIDLMETYREVAIGLTETYMNAMSNRLNEVMKVLTIIATIFMPLSFIAGVFGMNFQHMPEFEASWAYPWGYPIGFYGLCIAITGGMIWWFRRNHWI
jgi:magnesium transporter